MKTHSRSIILQTDTIVLSSPLKPWQQYYNSLRSNASHQLSILALIALGCRKVNRECPTSVPCHLPTGLTSYSVVQSFDCYVDLVSAQIQGIHPSEIGTIKRYLFQAIADESDQ